TLDRVVGELFDQRMSPYFKKLAGYFESPASWRLAFEEHRAIRDAIAAGDPAAARAAMRYHLQQSQLRFSRSFDEELEGEEAVRRRGKARKGKSRISSSTREEDK
ncbi:MAG: FCD domain-containing protein, partial [Alphaproteobacteria bacterium]